MLKPKNHVDLGANVTIWGQVQTDVQGKFGNYRRKLEKSINRDKQKWTIIWPQRVVVSIFKFYKSSKAQLYLVSMNFYTVPVTIFPPFL